MITAVSVDRIQYVMSVMAVAGVQKSGGEQAKEREYERIFEAAKRKEKEREETPSRKQSGFGRISCCYGKHAMELGFSELPVFDEVR